MDCGPAALKCLLEGFGVRASYERLREACQTGIDGSSIDTIEAVANQLGLQAEQIMAPVDHILLESAKTLPAIVVVKLPGGLTHFVVVWRKHGNFVQLMDPASGRRWVKIRQFAEEIYRHSMSVPAADWREYASSPDFQTALRSRLKHVGVATAKIAELTEEALKDPRWNSIAALDAAARLVTSLVESKATSRNSATGRLVQRFCQDPNLIPQRFWSVLARISDSEDAEALSVHGAVLVRIHGRQSIASKETLGRELSAAIEERPISPAQALLQFLGTDGKWSCLLIGFVLTLISAGLLGEALLFRTLFDVATELGLAGQRMGAMGAIISFSLILLSLEFSTFVGVARIARVLENRLRIAFLSKLPTLGDRYFQSRLISDMAERSHVTHRLRHLPDLLRQLIHSSCELCATAGAMIWLEPSSAPFVLSAAAAALLPALTTQSILRERDLRVRNHAAGLTRFYLDAALGLQAIRAHAAQSSIRREHERLLGAWAHAALRFQRLATCVEGIQLFSMFGLVASLFLVHPIQGMEVGRVLLVAYWALNLPVIGQEIATLARQYPYYRNLTMRLVDPLRAPEEESFSRGATKTDTYAAAPSIEFHGVHARASGQEILDGVTFSIQAGEHVALVGSSGAGKSSIAGVLLGWLTPSEGAVRIGGESLDVEKLRNSTAWVDPAVQVWNQSLYSNLSYGSEPDASAVSSTLDSAMLRHLLETLPEGLQTKLGESGGLVSGGEGQRVRLGRAMLKNDARLVILDEPFRGLDREKRRELLARARELWRDCTLLCITHDLSETLAFDQVLVVERGQVVEAGKPSEITASPGSRYAELLSTERATNARMWGGKFWRRITVHSSRLIEDRKPSTDSRRITEVA